MVSFITINYKYITKTKFLFPKLKTTVVFSVSERPSKCYFSLLRKLICYGQDIVQYLLTFGEFVKKGVCSIDQQYNQDW